MLNTLFDMLNMWLIDMSNMAIFTKRVYFELQTGHYGVKTCLTSQLGCMFVIQNWLINLFHTVGYEISNWEELHTVLASIIKDIKIGPLIATGHKPVQYEGQECHTLWHFQPHTR